MANINENYLNLQGSCIYLQILLKGCRLSSSSSRCRYHSSWYRRCYITTCSSNYRCYGAKLFKKWVKLKHSAVTVLNKVMDFLRQAIVDGDYKPLGRRHCN